MKTRNEIVGISFEYSLNTIKFSEQLEAKKKYVIARQLLKSGTSIGANIRESQSAESRADFVHKLKISQKEAEETEYWLLLCQHASYPKSEPKLMEQLLSIQKLLSRITSTTRSNKS